MKHAKRLASVLLAMVMVLAMALPAFAAAGDYTLTIKTVANHTYKIYQLATGDVSADGATLANIKVGANANAEITVKDIEKLAEESDDATIGSKALELINTSSNPIETVVGNGTPMSVNLPGGYYVVVDTYTSSADVADGDSISRTMVSLVKDETITPKTITVTPDKKILEGDGADQEEVEENEASIGDVITYRLRGTLPDMTGYTGFKYVFVDTMSKGLTPNFEEGDEISGKVGDKNAVFVVTEILNGTIRIALKDAYEYRNEKPNTEIYVDISATLNADAVVAGGSNENKVKIDYSNNPSSEYDGEPDFGNDDPKGTTPEENVKTYTTELEIKKVDGSDNSKLTGAEFKLESTNSANVGYVTGTKYVEDVNGDWYKLVDGAYTQTPYTTENASKYESDTRYSLQTVDKTTYTGEQTSAQAFVDENGVVKFTGLGVGDYTLTEVTTPDGFNTMAPISFSVGWTKESGFTVTMGEGTPEGFEITVTSADNKGATLGTTVPNNKGTELPSTGGIGTTIFYIVGGVLIVGAAILLIAKKRAR